MTLMANRKRPMIHVTLNPVLVERLKEYGKVLGETRLSALIDRAIEKLLESAQGTISGKKTTTKRPRSKPQK